MNLLPLDFRDQKFGCEIEMTGITRQQAAQAVAALFGTTARSLHSHSDYGAWEAEDSAGKKWRFVYDGSIDTFKHIGRRQEPAHDPNYAVEMNSPKQMPRVQVRIGRFGNLPRGVLHLCHGAKPCWLSAIGRAIALAWP